MPTYWPIDKKKIPYIINFRIIKDIAEIYFSIKTNLELSSDHSVIIINDNNKVVKKMQFYII